MKNSKTLPALAVLAGALLAALPADAQPAESGAAFFAATLDLELQNDNTFSSDDSQAEINDLFFTHELGLEAGINEHFSIVSGLVFEPVSDPAPGKDRFVGDHGLYVEQLFLQVKFGGSALIAGKFNPGFGTAWDATPGIYGVDFAEDYEITEMLGFGAAHAFATENSGTHTLGANIFFADTTVLSESLFTNRGRTTLGAGGAANTEELNSFTVTLNGADIPSMPGFTYHLAFRHLAEGRAGTSNEDGFAAGMAQQFQAWGETQLTLLGEVVGLFNAAAGPDDVFYATLGISIGRGPWHGEIAGTIRETDLAAGGSMTDYQFQVSAGRELFEGIDLSLGYKHDRQASIDSHTVGLLLTKSFEYDSRPSATP